MTVQYRLTDDELEGIEDAVRDAPSHIEALEAAVVGAFDLVMGTVGKSFLTEDSINPTHYAIPREQWLSICEALVKRSDSEVGVHLGLDWMNLGPSSYDGVS